MRRFLALAAFLLLFAVSRAEAQEEMGSPIFKHETTKEVLISKVGLGCPSDLFNITCKEFLGTLQAADAEGAPKLTKDLSPYLESLDEGLCGTEEARLATFYPFPRRVIMYNEVRRFSPTEKCLKRGGKNILSLRCGNANVTDLKVALSPPVIIKDTKFVHDTAFVPAKASAPADALPKPAPRPLVLEKKSHVLRNVAIGAGVVAVGVAVCAIIHCVKVEQTTNVGSQHNPGGGGKGGGPVNPPNIRGLMVQSTGGIRIPF